MAPHCGFELIFLPGERSAGKLRKLLIYLINAWKTLQVLRVKRPDVVWIQLPQVPLMWVALFYRKLFNRRALVIADCHNKMFRPPWSKFPFGIRLLSRCNFVLVHNDEVYKDAIALGISPDVTMVIEDPPAFFDKAAQVSPDKDIARPLLVFPASFAEDEPIKELLEAAAMVPSASFVITGNVLDCREQALIVNAPENVSFVGFLDREAFDRLLLSCDAVIALTRFDGIQLSVCGEAVGAAKPMLISDTVTLRRLFPEGNIFVQSDSAQAIAAGVHRLLGSLQSLSEKATTANFRLTNWWIEQRGQPLMRNIHTELTSIATQ